MVHSEELEVGNFNIYFEISEDCIISPNEITIHKKWLKDCLNIVSIIVSKEIYKKLNARKAGFSVIICSDKLVKKLNRTYRNIDKPTNTLSFPTNGFKSEIDEKIPYLGDIVISNDTLFVEAKAQKKDYYHHFAHILVHSLLHLLGYDHLNDVDEQKMIDKELEILEFLAREKSIKIKNPYFI